MTDDARNRFMCLLDICISFLIDILSVSKFFAHFLIGLLIFLRLVYESSVYILDTNPVSEICNADISQFVACLFIFLYGIF